MQHISLKFTTQDKSTNLIEQTGKTLIKIIKL